MIEPSPRSCSLLEPNGFVLLYEQHADQLLVWFTRRVLDAEVALDLMAETFAQAYLARNRYHGGSGEREAAGWLYGIARHQLSRYLRKGRAERRALRRLGMEPPVISVGEIERIEELAEIDSLRSEIAVGLARLGSGQRDALRFRIVEELPYTEVARRLGTSEQAARARVSRALRALGDLVEESQPAKETPG